MTSNLMSFEECVQLVVKKSPLQKKNILSFIENQGTQYSEQTSWFMSIMSKVLKMEGKDINYLVKAYLSVCKDMIREQLSFAKNGGYAFSDESQTKHIYEDSDLMNDYMHGLALSLFLWPQHYALFDFYSNILNDARILKSFFEIGPGHGLFTAEALRQYPEANVSALELSLASKQLAEKVISTASNRDNITITLGNIMDAEFTASTFDFVIMGEILEHVSRPVYALKRAASLLSENGSLFITTCANSPAIDHVYLYRSVEHIREHISEAELVVVKEKVFKLNGIADENEDKSPINYAALLRRKVK